MQYNQKINNPQYYTGKRKRFFQNVYTLIYQLAGNPSNPKSGYCWATADYLRQAIANKPDLDRSLSHTYYIIRQLIRDGWIEEKWFPNSSYRYFKPTNPMEQMISKGEYHVILLQIFQLNHFEIWRRQQKLSKTQITTELIEFFGYLARQDKLETYTIRALWRYFCNNYTARQRKKDDNPENQYNNTENHNYSFPDIRSHEQIERLIAECGSDKDRIRALASHLKANGWTSRLISGRYHYFKPG